MKYGKSRTLCQLPNIFFDGLLTAVNNEFM